MQDEEYQQCLFEATEKLKQAHEMLRIATFNLAAAGELKEWNQTIAIGDEINVTTELLEACGDVNVQLLAKLLREIESTHETIENLID